MAKRTPRPKSEGTPSAPVEPPRKTRGSRARETREVASEMATGQDQAAAMSDEFVGVAHTGEEPVQGGASRSTRSSSMSSEPSEEEVRMRAYQRYLERGGGDGMDFEDWLAAERELKPRH
jgi:hypothetical protein